VRKTAFREENAAVNESAADTILSRICEHAWQRAPQTTARLSAAGFAPGRWPDWYTATRIPVLDKKALATLQQSDPPLGGFCGQDCGPRSLFLSTGDVMEPALPAAELRLADWFRSCGLEKSDVVLNGFSYHLTPAGLLFHGALLRVGCTVLPAGPQNLDAALALAARSRITGFTGIAGHLKLLVQRGEELGFQVGRDLPLRLAFAGGEPFGGPIRQDLVARHGIRCFDFYGTADVGVVAGETAGQDGFALLDGVVAEVLDPHTGERLDDGDPGHLVLSVDNENYPLLRLGTGDVAVLSKGRLLGPYGRIDNSARVRGLLLYERQVQQALAAHPSITGGCVEINRRDGRDGIVATLVCSSEFPAAAESFAAAFRAACRLSVDQIFQADDAIDGPVLRDRRFGR
jgi:phenylacetate-CoA ligase